MPRLMNQQSTQVRGQVAVVDAAGAVVARAAGRDHAASDRGTASRGDAPSAGGGAVRRARLAGGSGGAPAAAVERVIGAGPELQIVERSASTDDPELRSAKAWLTDPLRGRSPSRRSSSFIPTPRAAPRDRRSTAPTICTCRQTSTTGSRPSSSTACATPSSAPAPGRSSSIRAASTRWCGWSRAGSVTVTKAGERADRRRLQPGAAVRLRRAAALQRADGRPGAGDARRSRRNRAA